MHKVGNVFIAMCVAITGSLLAEDALLEPIQAATRTFSKNCRLFSDRPFVAAPFDARLEGIPFLRATIDGGVSFRVAKAGTLSVITPIQKSPFSQANLLKQAGFQIDPSIRPWQFFGASPTDVVQVWRKEMQPGESMTFGKWVVIAGFDPSNQKMRVPPFVKALEKKLKDTPYEWYLDDLTINQPDYVVYLPKQSVNKDQRDPAKRGDTYNDHFQVIYKEKTKTFFAFWTQASVESDIDQHIAFSKSTDGGKIWTEVEIIAGSPNKKHPALLASWQQPMISKSGRIYCLWNQQTTSRGTHYGQMFGAYSDNEGETWSAPKMVPMTVRMDADDKDPFCPPAWCNWQRPLRLGEQNRYLVGLSRHGKADYDERFGCKVEFLQFDNIDEDPPIEKIRLSHFSTNKNALKVKKINQYEPACEEAAIVKLPDGRLFALMRSSIGYPVWSQSRDQGKTWSEVKILLDRDGGKPFLHPRSPCPLYDWKGCEAGSGTYFALVHNTFDPKGKTAYQHRGPLYLIAGKFNPQAAQPIEFSAPKLFAPRKGGNSFYTSYTFADGKGILWFPDKKFYLLGREIGPEWFE